MCDEVCFRNSPLSDTCMTCIEISTPPQACLLWYEGPWPSRQRVSREREESPRGTYSVFAQLHPFIFLRGRLLAELMRARKPEGGKPVQLSPVHTCYSQYIKTTPQNKYSITGFSEFSDTFEDTNEKPSNRLNGSISLECPIWTRWTKVANARWVNIINRSN